MTTPAFFPKLPGMSWPLKKTPIFSTRVAAHASGREVRAALYAHALYQFEATFDGLDSNRAYPGLREQSLQTLMGFYVACQGQFGTFLYEDPTDHFSGNAVIGTGDGTTTAFAAQRSLGGVAYEPVSWVTSLGAVTVNGTVSSVASLTTPNTIVFAGAPPSGAIIAASFRFAWLCRFLDDQVEFENFMNGLWKVGSLKFRSVR